jgi:SNF2 family DNA or RNA helicase
MYLRPSIDPAVLKRYDVVVTTYDTVQSEHAVYTPPIKDASATSKKKRPTNLDSDSESDLEDAMAQIKAKRGKTAPKKCALFDVKWHRVVLGQCFAPSAIDICSSSVDEAHNIKNVKTKRAVACCDLESKFRWCLTGTPM